MFDTVIRNGTVVDGTGRERFEGDVAILNGQIAAVGKNLGRGKEELDARGKLVAPGWVDMHTHYDGQAVWDQFLAPSSWHGVTTAVFGNCGVGFAPVRKGAEKYLINLMEGVEDIPESVLSEGLDFSWESFPEYMNVLENKLRIMDIGTQVPHAALRFFVMGERGANHQSVPTNDEIIKMSNLVEEALLAEGIAVNLAEIKVQWDQKVNEILSLATLKRPEDAWMQSGGKQGEHSEYLGYVLAVMQHLPRMYPEATW